MKNKIYITGIAIALVLSACTKHTIIEETITEVGQGPAEVDYYGVWKPQVTSTNNTEYYVFEKGSAYCKVLGLESSGFKYAYYNTVLVTATHFRIAGEGNRRYSLVGDTLTFIGGWDGPDERQVFVRVTDGSVDPAAWLKELKVLRSVFLPAYNQNNVSTQTSFGIDGDFLYISSWSNNWKIYKFNTLNGMHVDSASSISNNINAMHFKGNSNKLYLTNYTGTQTMQQRTGLAGANSNLSSNSLNSIYAISTNGSSGTVYAANSGNQIYSGSEGGNFSSLFTFTGNYPRCNVYYKSDQFLGVYNNTLVLYEISPSFKIIQQYALPGAQNVYQSIATNGTDIWVLTYNGSKNRYEYKKVALN